MKNVFFTLVFMLTGAFAFAETEVNTTVDTEAPHTVCGYWDDMTICITFEDPDCDGDACFTGIEME